MEIQTLKSQIRLDIADFPKVLLNLSLENWTPIILESYRTFLKMIGIEEKITEPINRNKTARLSNITIEGDAFIDGTDMYFILLKPIKDRNVGSFQGQVNISSGVYDWQKTYNTILDFNHQSSSLANNLQEGLAIGIISLEPESLKEKLRNFTHAVEKAILAMWDQSEIKSQKFGWQEIKPATPRLDKIISAEGEKSGLLFQRAEIHPKECEAAQTLTSKLARETLIEISQAGLAREQDILNKKGKARTEVESALIELKKSGLLNVQYLLECKKNATSLTQLQDSQQLESDEVRKLLCPFCGASFSQEHVAERYSLSDLGRKMIRKSHWMTIYVTKFLVELGIPKEAILWDIVEASEEVDLLVEFSNNYWVFELKDKEFASNHAHALSFRQVRYHANKAFIITTEKVSKDARNVFDEIARARKQDGSDESSPVYIEGLDAMEDTLWQEIESLKINFALSSASLLGELAGFNLRELFVDMINKHLKENDLGYAIGIKGSTV